MLTRALLKSRVVRSTNPAPPKSKPEAQEVPEAPKEGVTPVAEASEIATTPEPQASEPVEPEAPAKEDQPEASEALSVADFLAKSYSEINRQIYAGTWDSQLDELHDYESSNKDRKSVVAAITTRKTTIKV